MDRTPWGLSQLSPYGTPEMVEGEPVRVDPVTQTAVWYDMDGGLLPTLKHRPTVKHKQTSTSRSTDGSRPGDTSSDTDTDSSYD
ncbi:putative ATP-grasp-modified RiPP [Glycomyces sp. NPDC046736]|uniref:putative ATP-grasp-modified RiPP n=1 Tax=Glycomyces sp. NPDC046736 TaxID=3155615 RepID=UPI0033E7E145